MERAPAMGIEDPQGRRRRQCGSPSSVSGSSRLRASEPVRGATLGSLGRRTGRSSGWPWVAYLALGAGGSRATLVGRVPDLILGARSRISERSILEPSRFDAHGRRRFAPPGIEIGAPKGFNVRCRVTLGLAAHCPMLDVRSPRAMNVGRVRLAMGHPRGSPGETKVSDSR